MESVLVFGIVALLVCFALSSFVFNRIETGVFPEDYEFKLDPVWYVLGMMFISGTAVYFLFPTLPDMVHPLEYVLNILLPFIVAVLMYISYLFGSVLFMNLFTFSGAALVCYFLPQDFQLFPEQLTLWQDRLVTIAILYAISKGLELLNGLGAIASMQFSAVMVSTIFLAYFGAVPQILSVLACAYLGVMLAFAFLSWPPEKMIMSAGGFSCFGFILGCFVLNGAVEFAEAPLCIALSYLIAEMGIALYNHYICLDKTEYLFMSTSYYKTSQDGEYELDVVRGVFRIIVINVVLSVFQIVAQERLALPVFAIALDLWFLSILSGESQPQPIFSLTRLGTKAVKSVFSKKKNKDETEPKK